MKKVHRFEKCHRTLRIRLHHTKKQQATSDGTTIQETVADR